MAVKKGLLGKDRLETKAEEILKECQGDLVQIVLRSHVSHLTRFCANYIHQNVSESGQGVSVKVCFGKKIGSSSTNSLDEESVKEAIAAAVRMAELQKPNDEFQGMPGPSHYEEVNSFFDSTYEFTPQARASAVKVVVDAAKARGFEAAGAFSQGASEICVANSLGVRAYHASTSASLRTVVMSSTGSGYSQDSSMDVKDISPEKVASLAVEKCALSENPVAIEPGEYEVIMEPLAVADMLGYLARGGFSAQSVREGRSFLTGKLGQKIFSDSFSMWDDGLDPKGFPMPFDMEGVPKRKVVMVDKGVVKDLLYDFQTAKKEGKTPTGHGGFGGFGAFAANLFMAPGSFSLEDMVRSTERGILITRFHYTNMAHPMKVLVTGMTRDGTFLVEDGRIVKPVKNFRFTESALRVFGSLEMVGEEPERAGRAVVPAIKVPRFNFTGVTEF